MEFIHDKEFIHKSPIFDSVCVPRLWWHTRNIWPWVVCTVVYMGIRLIASYYEISHHDLERVNKLGYQVLNY